jgi:hypothetical protein
MVANATPQERLAAPPKPNIISKLVLSGNVPCPKLGTTSKPYLEHRLKEEGDSIAGFSQKLAT